MIICTDVLLKVLLPSGNTESAPDNRKGHKSSMIKITQVVDTGWFKKFIARCASESMINKMKRYEPQRLQEIRLHMDQPDYPWPDKEESDVFWQTYRRMVNGYSRQ